MGKGRLGGKTVQHVKNKCKRVQLFNTIRKDAAKADKAARTQRKKEAEALGDKAPVPPPQKTLDNTREVDETRVLADDAEVIGEDSMDEFARHFAGKEGPRLIFTTSKGPSAQMLSFVEEMVTILPNAEYRARKDVPLKTIVEGSAARSFTTLLVFTEKAKRVHGLWLVKLPIGPTARFKLSNLVMPRRIAGHGRPTGHRPELILNNFTTRLGHRLGRMLGCLVPHDPQFKGRQVVTMHNQRDFIFFRHHRYIFEQGEKESRVKARLQELGPRFTLKLKSLQLGTFDTQHGEYEWKHKPELDTSRRRFHI